MPTWFVVICMSYVVYWWRHEGACGDSQGSGEAGGGVGWAWEALAGNVQLLRWHGMHRFRARSCCEGWVLPRNRAVFRGRVWVRRLKVVHLVTVAGPWVGSGQGGGIVIGRKIAIILL